MKKKRQYILKAQNTTTWKVKSLQVTHNLSLVIEPRFLSALICDTKINFIEMKDERCISKLFKYSRGGYLPRIPNKADYYSALFFSRRKPDYHKEGQYIFKTNLTQTT